MTAASLFSHLSKGKRVFESYLEKAIKEEFSEKSELNEACAYALTNGGKRIRPLIVYAVAECLGFDAKIEDAALSIEYFHTASLIADDLPCMDNDDMRRCKPALHKAFGETVALLASYALIASGYEKIYASSEKMRAHPLLFPRSKEVSLLALKYASRAAGVFGATGGQFLDLFPKKLDYAMVRRIIDLKTVAPFEVAFLYGWLFGGGDLAKIDKVQKLAHHFGMAFQIADDIADIEQDKEKGQQMNMALFLGSGKALELFEEEVQSFSELCTDLSLKSQAMAELKQALLMHAGASN